jgi:SAM-dependent methyltransferase
MADRARENVPNVDVRTATFEGADLSAGSFGLVTCAQVWHWLDADTRVERIAHLLRPGGAAAIIANVQVAPSHNLAFWERVQNVYIEHTPGMEHQGEFRKPDDLPAHPLEGSDLFTDLEQVGHEWHWTLNTADYLGLCATHSNKAALDADTRRRLLTGIGELIDAEFDGRVTEYYVALAGLARRA